MEDVVTPRELAGSLDGKDVEWLLDDAQTRIVAPGVATGRTERLVGDVETSIAEDDLVADGDEGAREGAGLRVGGAQKVEG